MGMALSSFLLAFFGMEFAAWAAHKYLMHGPLWVLHEDHHVPNQKKIQNNDAFALFFAIPSFLCILFGEKLSPSPSLAAFGYGIMAYGAVYFVVHEVIIHRRYRFFRGRGWYFTALIMAHREHHRVRGKYGSDHFGMLWAKPEFFRKSWQKRKSMSANGLEAERGVQAIE